MEPTSFGDDFSATIRRTDKVQPALLVVAIVSAITFALSADGAASALAWVGAGAFLVTLVASAAVLVPLQRRIITESTARRSAVEEMRARWFRGHLGRSVLSVAAFGCLSVAAAL
jgi:hypothetical protein